MSNKRRRIGHGSGIPADPVIGGVGSEMDEHMMFFIHMAQQESQGARTSIELGPYSALVIIGALQMCNRHPRVPREVKAIHNQLVAQFAQLFAGTPGEEIIRRGGHPEWDVPVDGDRG